MKTIYVDVGCRKNPGPFEVQGVCDNKKLFYKPFKLGSNNIGEYLAIYIALRDYPDAIIYTDSITAISWVKRGCKTKVPMDSETRAMVSEADELFSSQPEIIKQIRFWNTVQRGENPADFHRKK